MAEPRFDLALMKVRFFQELPRLLWCGHSVIGSTTCCDLVSTGSSPVGHPKEVLCQLSKCGHCGGLKNRGTWFDPKSWHHSIRRVNQAGPDSVLKTEGSRKRIEFDSTSPPPIYYAPLR